MTHASICSGIDGPALAASWLGWQNLFHADINEFTNHILKFYYPDARQYTDIRKADFTEWRGKVDVLTAGFPCQPFSVAGQRTGEDHDSYLWPETLRVVNEVRPRWFIGENVNGIVSMVFPGEEINVGGQTDIFGEESPLYERTDRYILDRICCDLEAIGYETIPVVIPACAVGAPHERMRCFFITHDNGDERLSGIQLDEQLWETFVAESGFDAENPLCDGRDCIEWQEESAQRRLRDVSSGDNERICGNEGADTPDAASKLQQGNECGECEDTGRETLQFEDRETNPKQSGTMDEIRAFTNTHSEQCKKWGVRHYAPYRPEDKTGMDYRTARLGVDAIIAYAESIRQKRRYGQGEERRYQSAFGIKSHGCAGFWDNFPTQSPVCERNDELSRRLSGITFSKWRTESITAFGNAIVPLQILPLLHFIEIIDNYDFGNKLQRNLIEETR